jgi:hypothetical protein
MRRHLGVGPVDRGLVETGFDHRRLRVVRHDQPRHPADGGKRTGMAADPIAQTLRPGRLRIGKAGGAQHRDKDPGRPRLARQPVHHHRHLVPGVIDEEFFAAGMRLAHRDRELALPATVQFAEPGISVALRFLSDVLVPQDRERDVLALELPVHPGPIRLGTLPVPLLLPGILIHTGFEDTVGDIIAKRPDQARAGETLHCLAHRGRHNARPPGNLVLGDPLVTQTQNLAHMAHANSPRWHQSLPGQNQRGDLNTASEGALNPNYPGENIPEPMGEDLSESMGDNIPE